jgi:hypothetical protein
MNDNISITTDEKIKLLFEEIQNKKLAIQQAERPSWNTSCSFGFSASSAHDRINIQLINDIRKLVEIYAFLIDRKEKCEIAAKELGVDYKFTWLGFSVDEWKSDIQTRANQLMIQEKRKELNEIENRLNSIISPELRAKMELDAISNLLK